MGSARCAPTSIRIDELSLNELHRQQFVNLERIIGIAGHVRPNHLFDHGFSEKGPSKRTRIQQNLLYIRGQFVPIKDPEMMEFMPPQEQTFEMQWSQRMIQFCEPLRHSMIVRVLRLEGKFLEQMPGFSDSRK